MNAQDLITRTEIEAERRRIVRPSVDETFVPFRRDYEARRAAQSKPIVIAAAPHLARREAERGMPPVTPPVTPPDESDLMLATQAECNQVWTVALGGTLILIMLVAHAAAWLAGA